MSEKKENLLSPEEIKEMFASFLPMVHEFSLRAKEKNCQDMDVIRFNCFLTFSFLPDEKVLTYEDIEKTFQLHLQPLTQKDLDGKEQPSEPAT